MSSPVMVPQRPRRSLAGPIVLIVIGVLFLLRNVGVNIPLFRLFAHWWPLLLIIWGVVKLVEHFQAQRTGAPPPRLGFGGGFLIFVLVLTGLAFTGIDRAKEHINWGEVRDEMDVDNGFINMFGSTFTFDDTLEQGIPATADTLRIVCDRGNVAVNNWNEQKIKVVVHKRIFASNQNEATTWNQGTKPQIEMNGNTAVLNANTQGAGEHGVASDLEIYVPRKLAVDIAGRRGDVSVGGRDGEVKIATGRGDVMLDDLAANVNLTLRKGDVRISKVKGNVNIDGRFDDTTMTDIGGTVTLNGDFFGELKLSKVAKAVTFRSSRTDMEFARLDGSLDLESGDLRADKVIGPTRILTRSKEIHLEDFTGDIRVENSNGSVELHPADQQAVGNIEVSNKRGDVRLVMPAKASFQIDARTQRGEVQSDFAELKVENEHNRSAITGVVGNASTKVQITSDNGDIELRKVGSTTETKGMK